MCAKRAPFLLGEAWLIGQDTFKKKKKKGQVEWLVSVQENHPTQVSVVRRRMSPGRSRATFGTHPQAVLCLAVLNPRLWSREVGSQAPCEWTLGQAVFILAARVGWKCRREPRLGMWQEQSWGGVDGV